jgi:hypothetical protein
MKLTQFQSMVRIEYTEGEEATAVVRLPVLAASDVLLTAGLNVYWASPVLALPEPLKYIYKGMPAKVDLKPTEQPANPAGEATPDPKAAVTTANHFGGSSRNNLGWTGIARTLFEHIAAERKKQGLPALTPAAVETIQPMGTVEVDLVALLKSMQFPSGTYCLRRATPMDKLLVQPAPNRMLKQEHLNLLYHQLLYIQQELCEVKFIPADVVRDGTYNGGIVEDKQVVPDTDPEKPGTGSEEPKPKPKPEPNVDTETQAVPTAEHLQTQGYAIAYIHNGAPVIFGKAPFKTNKRGQQIDSNGYLTLSLTDTQLRVLNKGTAFTTYEAAIGKKPLAAELDAAGYTKDKAGKYYAVLPRQQTTVLPSNSPNGRFEEVSKDANGYSISYTAEAETGVYKWFVNLGTAEGKPSADPKEDTPKEGSPTEDPPVSKPPKEEPPAAPPSSDTGTVTPADPSPKPADPKPADPTPAHSEPARTPSSDPDDHGAYIKEYYVHSAPEVYYIKEDHVPTYLGYSRDARGNYPAIGDITKWVVAKDSPESARGTPPMYTDKHNSIVEWTGIADAGEGEPEGYWTLKLDEEPTSADARGSEAPTRAPAPAKPVRVIDQNAVVEKVPKSGHDTGYSRESYSKEQMRISGYEPNKWGRYDAIAPINKWVPDSNTPQWLRDILPQYSDAKNSEVEWVAQTDPDNPSQQGYWAVSKVRVK